MTPERFHQLADAYGGDLSRWPAGERETARALARARPEFAASLAQAAALDDRLAMSVARAATPALRDRVLAAAPRPAARGLGLGWLSSLGLAGACAAGLVMGVLIQPIPTTDEAASLAVLAPYEPPLALEAEIG